MKSRFFAYQIFKRTLKRKKIFYVRFSNGQTFSTGETKRFLAEEWARRKLTEIQEREKNTAAAQAIEAIREFKDRGGDKALFAFLIRYSVERLKPLADDTDKAALTDLFNGSIAEIDSSRAVGFIDYLTEFWDYEKSPYIRRQISQGHTLGRYHAANAAQRVRDYAKPYFNDEMLISITTAKLEAFKVHLMGTKSKRGTLLAPKSINHIMQSLAVGLGEACRLGMIPTNPATAVENLASDGAIKGIYPADLVGKLFADPGAWKDHRAYAANVLGAISGMRLGEVRGLKADQLFPDHIKVSRSFDKIAQDTKTTKTGKIRTVAIDKNIYELLKKLADQNPWGNGFIFYGDAKTAPIDEKYIRSALYKRLEELGIDDETRRKNNWTFHSWRHTWNSVLDGVISKEKRKLLIGHATDEMADSTYLHLTGEDNAKIRTAQAKFLQFKKAG